MAVNANIYVPSFLKAALAGGRPLSLTQGPLVDTNILSTASFRYDPSDAGLKSTQQLNVDWSQFQNHTFFMSAEAKVNLAFDQIINGFPFDGSRQEVERFFDNLTGFEKWTFDQFPTWHGELLFSGSFISVQNAAGALFPTLATNNSGTPVLNPTGSTSMTIEMQLYLPAVTNDVQTVCQMLGSTTQGFSLYLTQSFSTSSVQATFAVVSGSSFMSVPLTLNKGAFNHIAVELNRDNGLPYLQSFLGSNPVAVSTTQVEFGDMAINSAPFLIGSGSSLQLGTGLAVVPQTLLSGVLDEFRVFFSARTAQQQAAYASKALFATNDLVMYYRFNEPPPPIALSAADSINAIVLDYSGNSLHSRITNFTGSLRLNASVDPFNPVTNEAAASCPVLFPAYPPTLALNQQLLSTASLYDQENPNLITKLVPQHYLLEGALQDGFQEPEGTANQAYAGNGIPGQGKMGNVQIFVTLLYVYAKFFDELKLYVDAFSTLRTIDYESGSITAPDTVPDNFLNDFVRSYGFTLPPLFADGNIEQYVYGENVEVDQYSTNTNSLRYVQHTLMRRVLKNLPSILRSKGTQHSIKSFLRAVGIDADNALRIREVGGPTTQNLQFARENKVEQNAMVQFLGTESVTSPYLSASRIEPGFPPPVGTVLFGGNGRPTGTNNASDGLLTSGSWTWEGIVKFTPAMQSLLQSTTQSLARICVSGSLSSSVGLVANLLAMSSSINPKVVLYVRPNDYGDVSLAQAPYLRLEIDTPAPDQFTGPQVPNVFDANRWNVSFGRQRGDDGLNGPVSSSYFLRLAYQNNGQVQYFATTSSWFQESYVNSGSNVFQSLTSASSVFGPFLAFGTNQAIPSGSGAGYVFLNNTTAVPNEARTTSFTGLLSNVRFWSHALSIDEWKEHVKNYASVGVEQPLVNWNYVTIASGSWGRLRLNSMTQQAARTANGTASLGPTGSITFIDFSENNLHLAGKGFTTAQEAVVGEVFDMSFISPYFDEATTNEKVRIRSYLDPELVADTPWAGFAPVHEIDPSERPTDDVRFTMEFSLVDALNRDIVTIFATLDELDNALGDPTLAFSPDYPDLENLRKAYFNRIKQRLNFNAFMTFFRWFDASIGTFVEQLIPRKTVFKGVNFTVEPHMLERSKLEYQWSDAYLDEGTRQALNSSVLLQQIDGSVRKY